MWPKFGSNSNIKSDGKEIERELEARISLSVNEEYLSAFRTKSYADFFTKAHVLAAEAVPSSETLLLEPGQDAVAAILESAILPNKSQLKELIVDYFDISAEASKICSRLLNGINEVQSNHSLIQALLDAAIDDRDQFGSVLSELQSFMALKNPFSDLNKQDFKLISEKYSSVLQLLNSKRKKVARKMKLIACLNKASGIFVTAASVLVAVAAVMVAAHTLAAVVLGPAIFIGLARPLKKKKKKLKLANLMMRMGFLRRVGEQLDVAAKGTYILNRDFDTMSRLVERLDDEMERKKAMIEACLERRERFFWVQVLREMKKGDLGFRQQVEELEEHVYLCLVTINRARALVANQIAQAPSLSDAS
ncbi:UPF0496 protein At1g20180-like [Diospyros lotus]|uniref:UPF0496 protein At1g20180-like n=1 Tax=Diospyros lotus TaxID=55363 RepID=UPI0022512291|nr:UPF0496 protein At1g20180-like [Diospyros lotus]